MTTSGKKLPVKIYHREADEDNAGEGAGVAGGESGVRGFIARVVGSHREIPIDRLRGSLDTFLSTFAETLGGVPEALAGFHVDEIELSLDVSVSGDVSLILGGAEVEGAAGLKLTLKRK